MPGIGHGAHMAGDDEPTGGLRAAAIAYRAELLRFLAARAVPDDEAHDILQDVYMKAGALSSVPIGEPRAYLYRMTANLVADRRRSAARRAQRERSWMELEAAPDGERDAAPSAERAAIARQQLDSVATALRALPERTQAILRAYRIEGVPQKAIAVEFGISVSAVEKHLQRGYVAVMRARAELEDMVSHD